MWSVLSWSLSPEAGALRPHPTPSSFLASFFHVPSLQVLGKGRASKWEWPGASWGGDEGQEEEQRTSTAWMGSHREKAGTGSRGTLCRERQRGWGAGGAGSAALVSSRQVEVPWCGHCQQGNGQPEWTG